MKWVSHCFICFIKKNNQKIQLRESSWNEVGMNDNTRNHTTCYCQSDDWQPSVVFAGYSSFLLTNKLDSLYGFERECVFVLNTNQVKDRMKGSCYWMTCRSLSFIVILIMNPIEPKNESIVIINNNHDQHLSLPFSSSSASLSVSAGGKK